MVKRSRFLLVVILVTISSTLVFCAAKEALSQQHTDSSMRSSKYIAEGRPMIRMTAKGSGRTILSTLSVTRDLDR